MLLDSNMKSEDGASSFLLSTTHHDHSICETPTACMKLLAEAIQAIESLRKPKVSPIIPKASRAGDKTTMSKFLQEIQTIKTAITINQKSTRGH